MAFLVVVFTMGEPVYLLFVQMEMLTTWLVLSIGSSGKWLGIRDKGMEYFKSTKRVREPNSIVCEQRDEKDAWMEPW